MAKVSTTMYFDKAGDALSPGGPAYPMLSPKFLTAKDTQRWRWVPGTPRPMGHWGKTKETLDRPRSTSSDVSVEWSQYRILVRLRRIGVMAVQWFFGSGLGAFTSGSEYCQSRCNAVRPCDQITPATAPLCPTRSPPVSRPTRSPIRRVLRRSASRSQNPTLPFDNIDGAPWQSHPGRPGPP